jgi:hypothetical protein
MSYEANTMSIYRLYEYYNSLYSAEKRFFQGSQCESVFFTWYDSINGIESTQKSVEYEKASIIFNCAALHSQLAAICCDGKPSRLEEQLMHWQKAAGCLAYLGKNFSDSPTLDMTSFVTHFFTHVFMCQAYENRCKQTALAAHHRTATTTAATKYDLSEPKNSFLLYANCAKTFAHVIYIQSNFFLLKINIFFLNFCYFLKISSKYESTAASLVSNETVKNYLPEIWFYLIKIKACLCKSLAHYYAAVAMSVSNLDNFANDAEVAALYESLHDKRRITDQMSVSRSGGGGNVYSLFDYSSNKKTTEQHQQLFTTHQSYFQKKMIEQQFFYCGRVLKSGKRLVLARLHVKEAMGCVEEAMRQHGFCRKFAKEDNLYKQLQSLYDT